MTIRKLSGGLALLCLAGGATAAIRVVLNPTITPTSHDFGANVVGVQGNWHTFTVRVPQGGTPTDSLVGRFWPTNTPDFRISRNPGLRLRTLPNLPDCDNVTTYSRTPSTPNAPDVRLPAGTCEITIEFVPSSAGPKTATLYVLDTRGGQVSATLTGVGTLACRMDIIPCNYGLHYSGMFGWTSNVASPGSSSSEQVTVTIVRGVAACNGGVVNSEQGRTTSGQIMGTGLFGLEFGRDDTYSLYYRIVVACPSPSFRATSDAAAVPSRPAELGHDEQSSDQQRIPVLNLQAALALDSLFGTHSYPIPDSDGSGIMGAVDIRWVLRRHP